MATVPPPPRLQAAAGPRVSFNRDVHIKRFGTYKIILFYFFSCYCNIINVNAESIPTFNQPFVTVVDNLY